MIKPYYYRDGITIYNADCRQVLPQLGWCDVILTDPVWPNCPNGLLEGSDRPSELFSEMLQAMPYAPKRLIVVMRSDSDPRFLQVVPPSLPFFRAQILPYVMPGYIGRKLGGDEIAYSFGEPIPSAEGQRVIPGYAPKEQPAGRKADGHPCSRALGHFVWLCRWWVTPEDMLVDPFMGSGTTLVAAQRQGLKAIGIEINKEYCDIAIERLRQPSLLATA